MNLGCSMNGVRGVRMCALNPLFVMNEWVGLGGWVGWCLLQLHYLHSCGVGDRPTDPTLLVKEKDKEIKKGTDRRQTVRHLLSFLLETPRPGRPPHLLGSSLQTLQKHILYSLFLGE